MDRIVRTEAAQPNADDGGCGGQDGGVAVDDITAHMPDEDWATLTKEFFLT